MYHSWEGDETWHGGWTGAAGPTNEDAREGVEPAAHRYPSSQDQPLATGTAHLCGFSAPLLWHHDVLLVVEGAALPPSLPPTR